MLRDQADAMEYNKSLNSIKRGKIDTDGVELPKPIAHVKKPTTTHSANSSISIPSEEKPDDATSPTGINKSNAPVGKMVAEETKIDTRKRNDEKIRDMIKDTTENPTFKPMAGKKLSVKLDANNFMHTKTAIFGGRLAEKSGQDQKPVSDANSTLTATNTLKKTLSIRLKSRTTQNSRSRLETSEDHQKGFKLPVPREKDNHLKAVDDSDDSDDVKFSQKGPRLASETLDSMLRAPSGPVVVLGQNDKRQGRSMFGSVGGEKNSGSSVLEARVQFPTNGLKPAVAASNNTKFATAKAELQPEDGPITEGVPQVLSRQKPRTASLNLRKSLLPKPPSVVRG